MKLWNINKSTLELESIEIKRETENSYFTSSSVHWFNYRVQVPKVHRLVHISPSGAVRSFFENLDKQIERRERELERLKQQKNKLIFLHKEVID